MHQTPELHNHFEDSELRLIRREAEALARERRPRWLDADDLNSAGQLAWWRQRGNYDPEQGASRESYLKRVVRHAMLDELKAERTEGRRSAHQACSLDQAPVDGARAPREVLSEGLDLLAAWRLEHDLRIAAAQLTSRQRAVLEGMVLGYSMTAIARGLGVHRDTVYQDRHRIREVFQKFLLT